MSKSEYEEIFLWHENIRDYSSSETIFTLHKHLLWKLIFINQARNSNKRNYWWGDKSISCPSLGPIIITSGPGSPVVTSLTGDQGCSVPPLPHGQPITGHCHHPWPGVPGVSILTSLPRDRSITRMKGWLCVSPGKPISFCPADTGQIIPAVTVQVSVSKQLTSKFSSALRSYLLMLKRGKIRFISSFLSFHPQLDHWPAFGREKLWPALHILVNAYISWWMQRSGFFSEKSHESDQPQ